MGSPQGTGDRDEHPPHGVRVGAFCMDATEVTVARYRTCTGCTPPNTGGACNWSVAGRDNFPVNCVTWIQADAFCRAVGMRLPTEAEWEYAARGSEGRTYPWGNEPPVGRTCSSSGVNRTSTCPVGSLPAGATASGIYDLSGNVWEWVSDWKGDYPDNAGVVVDNPTGPADGHGRVNRGGGWNTDDDERLRGAYRAGNRPTSQDENLGFRCVR